MAIETRTYVYPHSPEIEELRRYSGWILALGICLVFVGLTALACVPLVTEVYVLYFGAFLIVSGVISGIQAFRLRRWAGCLLALLSGVLDLVVGFFMLTHTWEAVVIMTLLLAVFFCVTGLVRALAAVTLQFPNWGWSLASGIVTALLGIAIWQRWPLSSFWAIGLFVGLEVLFRGWSLVTLALAVRQLSAPSPQSPA